VRVRVSRVLGSDERGQKILETTSAWPLSWVLGSDERVRKILEIIRVAAARRLLPDRLRMLDTFPVKWPSITCSLVLRASSLTASTNARQCRKDNDDDR
jgi:hypothetical protein